MKFVSANFKKVLSLLVFACVASSNTQAFTDSTETIKLNIAPFYLSPGETRTVQLGNDWHHVQKIYIQANGAHSQDATFQVIANGDVKGTIYVPGRDPSYVVTIASVADSIQLQHVSGGTAHVRSITVVRSCRSVRATPPGEFYSDDYLSARNEASRLARRAITIVDKLQPFASHSEFGWYLLPIKKSAAIAYAAAEARGPISATVHVSLRQLKAQIEYAIPYIDETFERSGVFELAIELKSLGDRLDMLLR